MFRAASTQYELSTAGSQHRVRVHPVNAQCSASIWNKYSLSSIWLRSFMSHYREIPCVSQGYEFKISYREEFRNGCRFEGCGTCPRRELLHTACYCRVRGKKQRTTVMNPICQLILACDQLLSYFRRTPHEIISVAAIEPISECRYEIESIMHVLGCNKNICVKQILHTTPTAWPSSTKVSCFLVPSKRKASRCNVRPLRVSSIRALANRRLTRSG